MFLFKSNVYRPSGTSLLKALFLIRVKGVNFLRRFILRFSILRELIFADRGQSAKSAKIGTRKIFMLHGIHKLICLFWRWRCLLECNEVIPHLSRPVV